MGRSPRVVLKIDLNTQWGGPPGVVASWRPTRDVTELPNTPTKRMMIRTREDREPGFPFRAFVEAT